jgi:hypothetical protein
MAQETSPFRAPQNAFFDRALVMQENDRLRRDVARLTSQLETAERQRDEWRSRSHTMELEILRLRFGARNA